MRELEELAKSVKDKLGLEYNSESVEGFVDRMQNSMDPEKSDGFIASIGSLG